MSRRPGVFLLGRWFPVVGLWLLSVLSGVAAFAQSSPRPFSLDDLGLEVGLSGLRVSPDGRTAVVVTSRPNYDENRFENELVSVSVSDGSHRSLTFERHRVNSPSWSPQGDVLAFLALDEGNKMQVFLLPMSGGEATRLTSSSEGVRQYSWKPDGTAIAFAALEKAPDPSPETKHNRSFKVGRDVYFADSAARPVQLWVQPLGSDSDPVQLTTDQGGLQVYFGNPAFDWAPDGTSIVYLRQAQPHSGDALSAQLRLVELPSQRHRTLLEGPIASVGCEFSPDGSWIGVNMAAGVEPFFNPLSFYRVPIAGGEPEEVAPEIDRHVFGQWNRDGSVLLTGVDITTAATWIQPGQGQPRRLELGGLHVAEAEAITGGRVVSIARHEHRPAELYVSGPAGPPRRLTDFNTELASRVYGPVETIEWDGPDGFRQDGVLVYPPDYQEGQTYPLVLSIHGGPMSSSTEAFRAASMLLAAQGWVVFSPNYRGSSNRGSDYQRAVINDAGEGPGRDVMSGIEAVKKLGIVDSDRLAVSGWSYGGYMTTWLIAHYQGWSSAVAGAAVTDWFDWYNLADINNWAGYGLGGSPWRNDNIDNYWRQSPIAYAPQIRTPTLILSNTLDHRVTVTQSYKLYYALRDNDVEVEFVAYPVPGHFPGDPVHQKDVWKRWVDWIKDHF